MINGAVIYIYDGTFDGFLTCIFEAFDKKETPVAITLTGDVQLFLGAEVREIPTDMHRADRVYTGISKKLGEDILTMVYYAVLSAEPEAEIAALDFLRLAFRVGRQVYDDLTDELVWRIRKIAHAVGRESGQYLQFLRFSVLEGNILFGEFEPEPNVLPLIMPHFADRLNTQPFIIHDKGRSLAGVYDTKDWQLVSSDSMVLPEYSNGEKEYRELWKLFFNTIAIPERVNYKLQMQHLPKKYWKYVTEMSR